MKSKLLHYGRLISLIYVVIIGLDMLLAPVYDFISIDNLLMPFVFLYLVWNYLGKNRLFIFSLILVVLKVFTELLSSYLNIPDFSIQIMLWSMVWFKYFTFSWAALHVFSDVKTFHSMKRYMQVIINIVVILNLLQMLSIPGVSEFLQRIYVNNQVNVDLNVAGYDGFRLVGSQINPNNNAVVLLILLLLGFVLELRLKYFNAFILILLIFFTQSRTAFVVLILTLLILHSNYLRNIKLKQMLMVVGAFLVVLVMSSFLGLKYLLDIINGSAFSSNSFQTRLKNVDVILEKLSGKWSFGYGKIMNFNEFFNKSIDNEFAYEISQYGVVGVVLFVSFVIFIAMNLFSRGFKRYGIIFLTFIALIGITNLTLLNHQIGLMFLTIPILAFSFYNVSLKEDTQKEN